MPQGEEQPRVVIRDKRRIDPTSGAVRVPAGEQPAGTPPDPSAREQMSETDIPDVQTDPRFAPPVGGAGDDASRQLAERTADQLFPIVDDIERARDHGDLNGAFKVVADRVVGLLDGLGVVAFGVAGDPFDPALHEAVIHDTSSEVSVPTATTVLRQGYRRGDRVLRTAMVAVTDPESSVAAPAEPAPATDTPAGDAEPPSAG